MCKDFFEDLPFCKHKVLKDVNESESDSLALWFRTMWYSKKTSFPDNKSWKTFNLILFEIKFKNEIYRIYTLSDYGIKDPKYTDKIDANIGLLRITPVLLNNKNKLGGSNKIKSHKIKKKD